MVTQKLRADLPRCALRRGIERCDVTTASRLQRSLSPPTHPRSPKRDVPAQRAHTVHPSRVPTATRRAAPQLQHCACAHRMRTRWWAASAANRAARSSRGAGADASVAIVARAATATAERRLCILRRHSDPPGSTHAVPPAGKSGVRCRCALSKRIHWSAPSVAG